MDCVNMEYIGEKKRSFGTNHQHSLPYVISIVFIGCPFSRRQIIKTPLNLTKHYCRKSKNWSNYVIDTGPIHVRKCWPGSVTGMAWHGWAMDRCTRGPGINSRGTITFDGVSFKWDRLEREDSEKVLWFKRLNQDAYCGMLGYLCAPNSTTDLWWISSM